jgi:hypothetical protein
LDTNGSKWLHPTRIFDGPSVLGRDKNQIAFQHAKLANSKLATHMNAYWGEQLERLEKLMAGRASG